MSNDNTPPAKPLQDRFANAMEELVGMCLDGGLHPADMLPALRFWTQWAENAVNAGDRQ